jgi:hypothetical protein
MPTEYEFNPALKYADVIKNLPPGITLDARYGDKCELSISDNAENGVKGGRLFIEGIKHSLMTDGKSTAWLNETPNGDLRVYVFGMQVRREDGGHGWWADAFIAHYEPLIDSDDALEIWDMCNGSDEHHPPEHGYCVSDLPGVKW